MEMLLKLDQNIRDKIRNVVRVGFDKSAQPQNSGMISCQFDFVLRLCGFLELFLSARSGHLGPDLGPEVLEQTSLSLGVEKLGVNQTAQDF